MGSRQGALTGVDILVADDDDDTRQSLKSVLTYFGAQVSVVRTVTDGLAALRRTTPDVVIADMILGRSDGFALLRQARKAGVPAPFIAVSAQDFDREALNVAGFVGYLRKPVDPDQLVDTILAVIGDRS